MASQTPSEPPFRDLSTSAALSLARLAEQISKDSRNGTLVVEDAIGRFQLWVGNIGAVQFNNSPKSLDYRLRDAPHIRNTVRVGLERLRAASERGRVLLNVPLCVET